MNTCFFISLIYSISHFFHFFLFCSTSLECKQGPVAFTQFYANQSASNVSMVECVPIYHIQRHGHAGYGASFSFLRKQYSNQFNILSSGHVIVNNNNRDVLNVKSTPIAYKFVIDPYEDVSGNLIIDLKATEIVRVVSIVWWNEMSSLFSVYSLCVSLCQSVSLSIQDLNMDVWCEHQILVCLDNPWCKFTGNIICIFIFIVGHCWVDRCMCHNENSTDYSRW